MIKRWESDIKQQRARNGASNCKVYIFIWDLTAGERVFSRTRYFFHKVIFEANSAHFVVLTYFNPLFQLYSSITIYLYNVCFATQQFECKGYNNSSKKKNIILYLVRKQINATPNPYLIFLRIFHLALERLFLYTHKFVGWITVFFSQ